MENNKTYISMMSDSLTKKKKVLIALYEKTKEQYEVITSESVDGDRFDALTDEKGDYIDELNHLDEGFDQLYQKLEAELLNNPDRYKSDIVSMKSLIKDITDISARLQILEKKNHDSFQAYIADERKRLRAANMRTNTVMTYAQNMNGVHKPGNSYFVNESK